MTGVHGLAMRGRLMGCSKGVFSLSSCFCETRLVEQDEAGDDEGGRNTFDGERGMASVSTNLNLDMLWKCASSTRGTRRYVATAVVVRHLQDRATRTASHHVPRNLSQAWRGRKFCLRYERGMCYESATLGQQ